MNSTELQLDEKGKHWRTLILTWGEIRVIEEAIKLIGSLPEGTDEETTIKVATRLVVKRTLNGLTIGYVDFGESIIDLESLAPSQPFIDMSEGKIDIKIDEESKLLEEVHT